VSESEQNRSFYLMR